MVRLSAIVLKTEIECNILEINNPSRLLFVDLYFPHNQTNYSIIFSPVQLQEDWILRTYAKSMAFDACSTRWRWIQPGWGKADRCLFQATSRVSWGNKFLVVRNLKVDQDIATLTLAEEVESSSRYKSFIFNNDLHTDPMGIRSHYYHLLPWLLYYHIYKNLFLSQRRCDLF